MCKRADFKWPGLGRLMFEVHVKVRKKAITLVFLYSYLFVMWFVIWQ